MRFLSGSEQNDLSVEIREPAQSTQAGKKTVLTTAQPVAQRFNLNFGHRGFRAGLRTSLTTLW
jgi:hypothetical protein